MGAPTRKPFQSWASDEEVFLGRVVSDQDKVVLVLLGLVASAVESKVSVSFPSP